MYNSFLRIKRELFCDTERKSRMLCFYDKLFAAIMNRRLNIIAFIVIYFAICCARVRPNESKCVVVKFPAIRVKSTDDRCGYIRVAMNQCVGACRSVDKYPLGKGNTICTCCQPVDGIERTIQRSVLCWSNKGDMVTTVQNFTIWEPTVCSCRNCGSLRHY